MNLKHTIAAAALTAATAVSPQQGAAAEYWLAGNDQAETSSMDGSSACGGWATSSIGEKVESSATAGNIYHVGIRDGEPLQLRTPNNANGYAFAGDKLVLEGGRILHKGGNGTTGGGTTVTIANLEAASGSSQIALGWDGTQGFSGATWTVCEGAELQTYVIGNRNLVIDARIVGSGMLTFLSDDTPTSPASVTYKGDMSAFQGRFVASGSHTLVKFSAAGALSSGPAALDVESIVANDGVTLSFAEDTVVQGNRGMRLDAKGTVTINVAADRTVEVQGPISAPGGFVKTGQGTLIIDGAIVDSGLVVVREGKLLGNYGIRAQVSGCLGKADGQAHSPNVRILNPAEGAGCKVEWKVQGGSWTTTAPVFSEPGRHIVSWRISCEGYQTVQGLVAATLVDPSSVCAYVSKWGANIPPYDTPEKAATSPQDAVNAVRGQDVPEGAKRSVYVEPGKYVFSARVTANGVDIIGQLDRSVVFMGRGIKSENGEVSAVTFCSCVDGDAIQLVNAQLSNCLVDGVKNAVRTAGASTISRCVLKNANGGSYVVLAAGRTAVEATTIADNMVTDLPVPGAASCGGSVFVLGDGTGADAAQLAVTNCIVSSNSVTAGCCSAAVVSVLKVDNVGQSAQFERCVFRDNSGRCGFGRVFSGEQQGTMTSSISLRNCLCIGGKSVVGGGQDPTIFVYAPAGEIVNCTFDNCWSAFSLLYCGKGAYTVRNCIFRNIKSSDGKSTLQIGYSTDPASVYDTIVYPKSATETIRSESNHFDRDVTFVGPGARRPEYALASGSFGIGLGDISIWASEPQAIDLAGRKRVPKDKVDVGCYQTQPGGLIFFLY